jgi:hypothetical protein
MHRNRRDPRPRCAAAARRGSRWRDRAGYRGAASGTGFVVDAASRYSGPGGGKADFRASGAATGCGAARTGRPYREPLGAAVLRRDRAGPPGRSSRRRLRAGQRGGTPGPGRAVAVRAGWRGRRARQAPRGRARPAVGVRADRGRARRRVWPRADRARGDCRRPACPAAAARSFAVDRPARRIRGGSRSGAREDGFCAGGAGVTGWWYRSA